MKRLSAESKNDDDTHFTVFLANATWSLPFSFKEVKPMLFGVGVITVLDFLSELFHLKNFP